MAIAFEKPDDFEPTFTAYVLNNRQFLFGIYVLLFVFIVGVPITLYEQEYVAVSACCFSILVLFLLLRPMRRLAKNPVVVSLSSQGVWLPIQDVFIPKDQFIRVGQLKKTMIVNGMRAKKHNIEITFRAKKGQRYAISKWFWFFIKCKHITPTQSEISLPIPFTVGTLDNIGLNVTKSELIDAFEILKKNE